MRKGRGPLYLGLLLVDLYKDLEYILAELGQQKIQFRISLETKFDNPLFIQDGVSILPLPLSCLINDFSPPLTLSIQKKPG